MKRFILNCFFCSTLIFTLNAQSAYAPMSAADNLAFNAPCFEGQKMDNLVQFCNNNVSTEADKVRFYFVWITLNVSYDLNELWLKTRHPEHQETEFVFAKRKALCRGFANLFADLCKSSGIKAQTIIGYTRSKDGEVDLNELHAWNAVNIDRNWHLFDVTWAANHFSSTQSLDNQFDKYYKQNPIEFRKRHLPFDPVWQLLPEALSRKTFLAASIEGVAYETVLNNNYAEIIENDLKLNEIEQNIRSYQRAINFMPDEKRLYDVLNFYKSEKARNSFIYACSLLDYFKKVDAKEVTKWTLTDVQKMITQARLAQSLFLEAQKIYASMTNSNDLNTHATKSENYESIQHNLKATDKLISFLLSLETDLQSKAPVKPLSKPKAILIKSCTTR